LRPSISISDGKKFRRFLVTNHLSDGSIQPEYATTRIESDQHNRHASVTSMCNFGGFFVVLALSLDG
jgi:hypothetical protein